MSKANFLSAGAPQADLDHLEAKGIDFVKLWALVDKYKQYVPAFGQMATDLVALVKGFSFSALLSFYEKYRQYVPVAEQFIADLSAVFA